MVSGSFTISWPKVRRNVLISSEFQRGTTPAFGTPLAYTAGMAASNPSLRRHVGPGRLGEVLRSIEHPGGRVRVHYRGGDLEVMVVEVAAERSLTDPMLQGQSSWHLVLEGQALFDVGGARWELLPDESLSLETATPYTITNPSPTRLRVLSVVSGARGVECEGGL